MPKKVKKYKVTISNYPKTKEERTVITKNISELNKQKLWYTVDKLNLCKKDKVLLAKEIAKMYDNDIKERY